MEEPPKKVVKMDSGPPSIESNIDDSHMDEAQEEWLSEGVLTDDDYNANLEQTKEELTEKKMFDNSQSTNDSVDTINNGTNTSKEENKNNKEIEETLDKLEKNDQSFPEELEAFLIRKSDGKEISMKKEEEKLSDDGNDTDDLLRMLGDGEKQNKGKVLKSLKERSSTRDEMVSSDDDFDVFKGAKVKKVQVSKKVLMQQSMKSQEEISTECESSDEVATIKQMFTSKNIKISQKKRTGENKIRTEESKPVKNSNKEIKSPAFPTKITPASMKTQQHSVTQMDSLNDEDNCNDAEYLDEDEFDLDENFTKSVPKKSQTQETQQIMQQIMQPEKMDEAAPSDDEYSHSEADSLYDELPSSISEDELDDMFHLDIRAERAGEYIPLLGPKARDLLLQEKQRVAEKLDTLKESIVTLTENRRQQTQQLQRATLALAELDAVLAAS